MITPRWSRCLPAGLTHYREAAETGKKDGFEILPDLWLIDGGAGQVAVAKRVAEQFGLEIPVFGMVKDDRHRTRATGGKRGDRHPVPASRCSGWSPISRMRPTGMPLAFRAKSTKKPALPPH